MIAVRFRFYAQLNDFLPPGRRHRRFGHQLAGPRSIEDAIESLGIPHPEVDRECAGCGRIYWRGSHYARLLALLERARQRVRSPESVTLEG